MVAIIGGIVMCPPIVAALGTSGASAVTGAALSGAAAIEGMTAGAAVVAVGEGALVATGAAAGGSSAGIALATLAGPIGCLIVGCEDMDISSVEEEEEGGNNPGITWDCWKPIVHDMSVTPSEGMALRTLAVHPNVKFVNMSTSSSLLDEDAGRFLVENVFGERFCLGYVNVGGTLALHASRLSLM
ncbi:hypothetical protein TWF225_001538 [Orbilia oligospora]|uniref:Uncharacterized protein n=1 Tax=Orbilia oligospora TaxID=2813651 RepID=A0A7C8K4D6_ORBOL|nr:hypothetical protein TWF751_010366 [Orbilia oligospora]KAF3191406.1 hypothetical protein TWF225_001538 [Orbilia oligospora]KAF3267872.1 hypothetical protein TWF217_011598 [Orbilia oligospora]KAF3269598.1 hypothetical protein TWF128_005796 [Orbilia oligospora]KAF3269599.1 hypothetical protein TWF128_005796 [Orbilia oligospora]